jgi:hypothetical protein
VSGAVSGAQWGDWDGRMVVGIMGIGFGGTPVGQRIEAIELTADGNEIATMTRMTLPMESGRFRYLVQGPDGSPYAAVDGGTIHNLTPTID